MMSNKSIFSVNCTFFIHLIYMKNNFTFIARLPPTYPHTVRLIFKHFLPSLGPLEETGFSFFPLPHPESLAHIKVVRLHTRKTGKNERVRVRVCCRSQPFLWHAERWHTASSLHTTHSSTPEHVSTCANVGSCSSIKGTCISLHNDKKP